MRNPALQLEDNSDSGRTLSLAYQLFDAYGRTAVSTSGLRVVPVVKLATSSLSLLACPAPGVGGIGNCEAVVDAGAFPAQGQTAQATVTLSLYRG